MFSERSVRAAYYYDISFIFKTTHSLLTDRVRRKVERTEERRRHARELAEQYVADNPEHARPEAAHPTGATVKPAHAHAAPDASAPFAGLFIC